MTNYIGNRPSIELIQSYADKWDYINTGNPAVDTNPSSIGATWLNLTTGEEFVCTDSTAGVNVWIGSLDNYIKPYYLSIDYIDIADQAIANGTTFTSGVKQGNGIYVTDTAGGTVSIASAFLSMVGSASWTTTGWWGVDSFPRADGQIIYYKIKTPSGPTATLWGVHSAQTLTSAIEVGIYYDGTSIYLGSPLAAMTRSVVYEIAIVLGVTGSRLFAKGGTQYPDWTYMGQETTTSAATLYPISLQNTATAMYTQVVKIPKKLEPTLWDVVDYKAILDYI